MNKLFLLSLVLSSLILISCENEQDFLFAWLSDTHISTTSSGEEDLSQAVQDINQLENISFVIISGDITDLNINDNLHRTKLILDRLQMPYYIIPGNHDTKWSDTANQNFIDLWGSDKFKFNYGKYTFIGLHQGPLLRMMDGHFAREDLVWLENKLQTLKYKHAPLIFITHYPIDNTVDNYTSFLSLIKPYNVRLFLHGHGHRNRIKKYAGIPGVMGRSSLRRNKNSGGYTLVHVKGDSLYFYERISMTQSQALWGRLDLHKDVSPGQKNDLSFHDSSSYKMNNTIEIQWIYDTGNTVTASPLINDSLLYIGDRSGVIYCLRLTSGRLKWQFSGTEPVYSTVSLCGNRLIFNTLDGSLFCLDASVGSLLWQTKIPAASIASPSCDEHSVYIGSSDHLFRAYNINNGRLKWQYSGIDGYVETKPLIYKQSVIFGAWDQKLYALNKENGHLLWFWQGGKQNILFSPAACWPVAANNIIYIVAPDRYITAIDYSGGQTLWRSNKYKVRESIGISEDGQQIFARCMNDTIFSIASCNKDIHYNWVKNIGFGYDIAPSMLTEKDGFIFVATKNGLILALDQENGELIWKYKFDNTLIHTISALNRKQIFFSNIDGKIVSLKYNEK